MEEREKAIQEETIGIFNLELWCNRSKREKGDTRAAVVWKSD